MSQWGKWKIPSLLASRIWWAWFLNHHSGSQEESKWSCDRNCKEPFWPCAPPAWPTSRLLCTTPAHGFTPERRCRQGQTRCTPIVCFFLAQNIFLRKLMSGKKLSVLVMPTAIRSTNNFSLGLFQISWGRNSISAANFILFSLGKYSELVDYTRQCVWTFTPTLPTYIYRHTIETHTYIRTYIHILGCQEDVCCWNA